ncbi:VanZ family protein [Streptomyces cyaneofuscatus]|uniref:VanZ family protein n=1 Tax=Streptomyces cyaneofuscatus TaxID=66883 RepID=UPI0037FC28C2
MLLRVTVLTVVLLGLVAFSILLAKVTLTPSPASADIVTSNLRPGRSLRQYAEDYTFLAACKQAGGNVLLGVPFGLLLPFLVPRRLRMISMTLLTAAAMVLVELVQGALVTGRAFDIDDVILNTSGALLGYLLLGRRISHSYHVRAHTPRAEAVDPAAEPKAAERETPSRTKAKTPTKAGAKTGTTNTGATKTGTTKAGTPTRGMTKAKEPVETGARAGSTRLTKARGSSGRPTAGAAQPGSGRALLDRLRRR